LVAVDVANIGGSDGDEVVQIYAVPPATSHPRESRALCGFDRVHLKAGERKTVNLVVPTSALRRWSDYEKAYAVPTGSWSIGAGASSADIRETAEVKL
jgi:beta-glucosidase